MTPAQKSQQTAYNEFIADYIERHGECKATRDEAHEVADKVVEMSKRAARMITSPQHDDLANSLSAMIIDSNTDIDGKDEAKFLAACAIAAALGVMG